MHLHIEGIKHEQIQWLELVNNYDCEFHYYPSKANKVVDALSQKVVAFTFTVEKMLT